MHLSPRSSGILLHPTSLPGPYGIGDLGQAARDWVAALAHAKQTWWQILPLGPPGFGDSPYQCFSAFAGNPWLVSPDELVEQDLLDRKELADVDFPPGRVDFGNVIPFKEHLFARAWERFREGSFPKLKESFEQFREEERKWLEDYSLFMAIKGQQDGKSWYEWPDGLRTRKADALKAARRDLDDTVRHWQFRQFLFFQQWRALREYAEEKGISILGDIPIFVSGDSADVWANPKLFLLNKQHRPKVVAGVPPDYFCKTGQLWGNPLYDWEAMRGDSYAWWIDRVKAMLGQVDWIRLDHFCGFEAAWHVPAGEETAINGKYVPGPGAHFFETVRKELDRLPFIAEDLGTVTPAVEELRDKFELPGMRVLHFAFGEDGKNPFLPHNYPHRTVAYTGTHDNNTSVGWYEEISDEERDHYRRYAARDGSDVAGTLMRLVWSSVAEVAIAPLQDLMRLGSKARMNYPGHAVGNWSWRYTPEMLTEELLEQLKELTLLYRREPEEPEVND